MSYVNCLYIATYWVDRDGRFGSKFVAPQLLYPASPNRAAASSVECYIYGQCELLKNLLHGKSRTALDVEKS